MKCMNGKTHRGNRISSLLTRRNVLLISTEKLRTIDSINGALSKVDWIMSSRASFSTSKHLQEQTSHWLSHFSNCRQDRSQRKVRMLLLLVIASLNISDTQRKWNYLPVDVLEGIWYVHMFREFSQGWERRVCTEAVLCARVWEDKGETSARSKFSSSSFFSLGKYRTWSFKAIRLLPCVFAIRKGGKTKRKRFIPLASIVGSYFSTNFEWQNWTVKADLPTPPGPRTTTLYSFMWTARPRWRRLLMKFKRAAH